MLTRVSIIITVLLLIGCGGSSPDGASSASAPGTSGIPQPGPSPTSTSTPLSKNLVLVANRGAGSVSVIDADTDTLVSTIALPAAANSSEPGYIVYSKALNRVYVGDSGNSRIVVFDGDTLTHLTDLPMRADVFHMWESANQMWVVDRTDKSVAVFDLTTNGLLTVIGLPADLIALEGEPHDVVVDSSNAFVSVQTTSGTPDVVLKYSRSTFTEVGRAQVGEDPHLFLHPMNRNLYVACQDTDNVYELDRDSLAQLNIVDILGGHGIWIPPHGLSLYVTNTPGHIVGGNPGPGSSGLFAIDLTTKQVLGELVTQFTAPHNLTSSADGKKLYLTHSNGGVRVSVYDIATPTSVPVFRKAVDVGTNPFGLTFVQRP